MGELEKAIEEANQKTAQVFIDLINKTYGNNQRLFRIIFILLGAILALSGARVREKAALAKAVPPLRG